MAPKRVLAAIASAALLGLGVPALAGEYRAGELLNLDLSKAVLSPKRIGPPAEFAPVPVEARTDPKQVAAEPQAERRRVVRTGKMIQPPVAKPRGAARTRLAHRHGNPLDAQAMDTRIQTWPCKSGGICNWKR